ncbi:hypothetical protein Bbelb_062700 [Branchiostoma belcheri]|nr:hypothetical protein Bbelb_062700 [Branchiostoma belcheri]
METLPTVIRLLCGLYFVYTSFVWSAGSLLALVLFAEHPVSKATESPWRREHPKRSGGKIHASHPGSRVLRRRFVQFAAELHECEGRNGMRVRPVGSTVGVGGLGGPTQLRSLPMFMKFCAVQSHLGLDGFLFELPAKDFGNSPEDLGNGVRRLLKVLSDVDPAGVHCMDKSYISKRGWCFEFDRCTFFVTTFAPCYPETHSRYNFSSENSFVLLQPEESFLRHDIGTDTPHTDWEHPRTVRDQIRAAYRRAGRPYLIRDTVIYPPVHDIVKPLGGATAPGDVVAWWEG